MKKISQQSIFEMSIEEKEKLAETATDLDLLKQLARDEQSAVRRAIAKNPI